MLEDKARREFEEILAERDVGNGLKGLEDVVREARERKNKHDADSAVAARPENEGRGKEGVMTMTDQQPLHTLPPSILVQAHLAPYLSTTNDQLTQNLNTVRAENEQITAQIRAQEAEIEELVAGVEALVGDLMGANAAFNPKGKEGGNNNNIQVMDARAWRREAESVDAEMRDG